MSDEKRLQKINDGDRAELRKLLMELEIEVGRFVNWKISNRKDAEEVIQDVLLSFVEALPLFAGQSSFKTFILGIAKHEVADYWRKKYAKRVIKTIPIIKNIYDRKLSSLEKTQRDMYECVERVYEMIDPKQERVLRLKYEKGLSMKEIAVEMKLTVKAVESLLYRARKKYQELYIDLYGKPAFSVRKES
jgi:RNA polymerase sigma factor (sigma-70 family)